MEIRTYQGTDFCVCRLGDPDDDNFFYSGDLTNARDLLVLAKIIKKAEDEGVDLDFSID